MARGMAVSVSWMWCVIAILLSRSAAAKRNEQQPLVLGETRPNILFILTDDQDLHMDSLSYMPLLKKHLVDRGTSFTRYFCTVALCCPSRVSMWTGKAAHNTNVTDLWPPWGGYPKFVSQGFNEDYVPVWLQAAGYATYYVGKLFNAHTVRNYHSPHAAGWTGSDFLLDPYTYRYLNATFQRNHEEPASYEGQYATDVLAKKAHGFLEDAIADYDKDGKPFFLTVAPTAPHSDVSGGQAPPIPAERHKHLFKDAVVPRTPNFNPDTPGGAYWIAKLPKQNQSNIDYNDEWYRNRLRTLQVVDELVDSLVIRLGDAGLLDNTYIFYSTDNGYTIGQHRRQPGKQCAFEGDINIPFIVRGPGIPEGVTTDLVASHTDLAPTFLSLAKAPPPKKFQLDGQAIPLTNLGNLALKSESIELDGSSLNWPQEHVNVEMWGIIMSEGRYGMVEYPNHTYKALRIAGSGYDLLYTIWCNNEHELYDMTIDPYQLINLWNDELAAVVDGMSKSGHPSIFNASCTQIEYLTQIEGRSVIQSFVETAMRSVPEIARLVHRLDSLLMVLKTCVGIQCSRPWKSLFPEDQVKSLSEALDPQYDEFFATHVDRVHYSQCERGYIAESEGPMWNDGYSYAMFHEVVNEL